jgi:hypothetical protein
VEFTIAGIASMVLMISTVELAFAMWNYHTLAYAVHETNRYIIVHGRKCMMGTNDCTITVANIVSKFESNGIGLDPSKVNLTLTSTTNSQSCNPITTCATLNDTSANMWPPKTNFDNMAGKYSTISATYTMSPVALLMWFRRPTQQISTINLTSTSMLQILF